MLGYPRLDACLNISWFLEVMASPKTTTDQTLNNRNSGRETIVLTTVIVVRTIPKFQVLAFPIVPAIVLPTQFLLFKIQCPATSTGDFFYYLLIWPPLEPANQ